MRYVYIFIFLLCINAYAGAQADKADSVKGLQVPGNNARIRISCSAGHTDPGKRPVVVVDGDMIAFDSLKSINPDDIESIEILKSSSASAIYSQQSLYGVILITTKRYKQSLVLLKDEEDGSPVPAATLTFLRLSDEKESISIVADTAGRVRTGAFKPGEKYKLSITSVGYRPFYSTFILPEEKRTFTYNLTRDIKENEPVVVSVTSCTGHHRIYGSCRVPGAYCSLIRVADSVQEQSLSGSLKIFPNPLTRGGLLRSKCMSPHHLPCR